MLDKLSYLAGLMDGEGSAGYFSNGRNRPVFTLEIKMACEPIIDWCHQNFGGSKQFRRRAKPHYKDQWRWRLKGVKAIELYTSLKPLLLLK